MKLNFLIILGLFSFLCQIGFSFYFSSTIVLLNRQYNHNQTILAQNKLRQENLTQQLIQLTGDDYLTGQIPDLSPINRNFP